MIKFFDYWRRLEKKFPKRAYLVIIFLIVFFPYLYIYLLSFVGLRWLGAIIADWVLLGIIGAGGLVAMHYAYLPKVVGHPKVTKSMLRDFRVVAFILVFTTTPFSFWSFSIYAHDLYLVATHDQRTIFKGTVLEVGPKDDSGTSAVRKVVWPSEKIRSINDNSIKNYHFTFIVVYPKIGHTYEFIVLPQQNKIIDWKEVKM